ncbi:hypothetical protein JCM1841_001470 [Sporobolomyces salmonicolor]
MPTARITTAVLFRQPLRSRPFSTSPSQRKPALAYHNLFASSSELPPPSPTRDPASNGTTRPSSPARGAAPGLSQEHSADKKAVQPTDSGDRPRRAQSPPRPPSPYGEINDLARHPTLYEPVLKPRFPIILCHGLYGFDVRGPGFFRLHYWGDMLKILRGKIGAEVYVTAVPGTGSVKNRAQVLHQALEDTPALLNRDLNFVAHSMGGLDARYLISNIRPSLYHPRSLTTVCTPHRGSEFMAWCRANIGIGTELENSDAFSLRPSISSSLDEPDDASIPLPFSLKSPILSREQVEAAKKAAQAAKKAAALGQKVKDSIGFPGLPFGLSTSVTSYLLNLLDSPAYANLTPSFLRDVFNPSTPDVEGVKYYSIAGRTDKIPIWHPLWLPKVVLDGAEQARIAQGVAAPPEWRGNDGLVNIDSARWGEFLGTFDYADHWEMRGSSGLISAEASKHAVEEMTRSEFRDTREPRQGEKAEKVEGGNEDKVDKGWQWQDVYALIGKLTGNGKSNGNGAKAKEQKDTSKALVATKEGTVEKAVVKVEPDKKEESEDSKGLNSAAHWIIRQLPGGGKSSSSSSSPSTSSSPSSTPSPPSSTSSPPSPPARTSGEPSNLDRVADAASSASSVASTVTDNLLSNPATRLLYGAPGVSSATLKSQRAESRAPSKPDKFSLERMTLALCRKLHNEGL